MVGEAVWGWSPFCLAVKPTPCALGCPPICLYMLPQTTGNLKSFRKKKIALGALPISLCFVFLKGGCWTSRAHLH